MPHTPIEYELYCLSLMRLEGWVGNATPITSDQGADVICDYGDVRAVIQCKLYDQPVGNSAVQEVISARIFYEANVAAVVTNASFTRSASQLAEKARVALLHDSQLREWARRNRSRGTADNSELSSIQEVTDALNVHGFRVRKTSTNAFSVSTPNGPRYVSGEGALRTLAEQLLGLPPSQ